MYGPAPGLSLPCSQRRQSYVFLSRLDEMQPVDPLAFMTPSPPSSTLAVLFPGWKPREKRNSWRKKERGPMGGNETKARARFRWDAESAAKKGGSQSPKGGRWGK